LFYFAEYPAGMNEEVEPYEAQTCLSGRQARNESAVFERSRVGYSVLLRQGFVEFFEALAKKNFEE